MKKHVLKRWVCINPQLVYVSSPHLSSQLTVPRDSFAQRNYTGPSVLHPEFTPGLETVNVSCDEYAKKIVKDEKGLNWNSSNDPVYSSWRFFPCWDIAEKFGNPLANERCPSICSWGGGEDVDNMSLEPIWWRHRPILRGVSWLRTSMAYGCDFLSLVHHYAMKQLRYRSVCCQLLIQPCVNNGCFLVISDREISVLSN